MLQQMSHVAVWDFLVQLLHNVTGAVAPGAVVAGIVADNSNLRLHQKKEGKIY